MPSYELPTIIDVRSIPVASGAPRRARILHDTIPKESRVLSKCNGISGTSSPQDRDSASYEGRNNRPTSRMVSSPCQVCRFPRSQDSCLDLFRRRGRNTRGATSFHKAEGPGLGYAVLTIELPGQGTPLRRDGARMQPEGEILVDSVLSSLTLLATTTRHGSNSGHWPVSTTSLTEQYH